MRFFVFFDITFGTVTRIINYITPVITKVSTLILILYKHLTLDSIKLNIENDFF